MPRVTTVRRSDLDRVLKALGHAGLTVALSLGWVE
jgi:hypothetical protein